MKRAVLLFVLAVAGVPGSAAGQGNELVPNPYGVGPAQVPAYVPYYCDRAKQKENMPPRECLVKMGFPVDAEADAAMPSPDEIAFAGCRPPRQRDGWWSTGFSDWVEGKETVMLDGDSQDVAYWSRTDFLFKAVPSAGSKRPDTLEVRTRTELDLTALRALMLQAVRAFEPNSESCSKTRSHSERFYVKGGAAWVGFDTTHEKWACTHGTCVEQREQCRLRVCVKVPATVGCEWRTQLGSHTVGVDAALRPRMDSGAIVFDLEHHLDTRGGLPDWMKALGELEKVWNKVTFDSAFFHSGNYAAAVETLRQVSGDLTARNGRVFKKVVAVPGMQVVNFAVADPEFFEVTESEPRLRLKVDGTASLPLRFACDVMSGIEEFTGRKWGR